jgi:hypothetical protein
MKSIVCLGNLLTRTVILAALTTLAGCQLLSPSSPTTLYKRIAWEHQQPGCSQRCPLLNVDTLHYHDEPLLNAEIERRLLQLADPDRQFPQADSLLAFERSFLPLAEPGWAYFVQAKQRDAHGSMLVIELSSYIDRGGAHGAPGRGFINYDRATRRVLSLQDLLLPGQEAAFWRVAEQAHQSWLAGNDFDQDTEFRTQWPFKPTEHVALLKTELQLKYDVYAIAPYASGHPELSIDYAQLKGILKPAYLP